MLGGNARGKEIDLNPGAIDYQIGKQIAVHKGPAKDRKPQRILKGVRRVGVNGTGPCWVGPGNGASQRKSNIIYTTISRPSETLKVEDRGRIRHVKNTLLKWLATQPAAQYRQEV